MVKTKTKPKTENVEIFYCPRSCHNGRSYSSLAAVIKHVELQHPDHDPNWWKGPKDVD
jgi:hypothetical protein